jgi:hypothetical protein
LNADRAQLKASVILFPFQNKVTVMTNADVFIQILSEASGRPPDQVQDMLDNFLRFTGASHRFDQELSDAQAEELLIQLRRELPGIRRWLAQGAFEAREIIKDASRRN